MRKNIDVCDQLSVKSIRNYGSCGTASCYVKVSRDNALDFAKAEERLAQWNPINGGRLTGTALWDGKIFSSFGQYRAFQIDQVYRLPWHTR